MILIHEFPLLTECLIGESTGEEMEGPKLRPARRLSGGDLDGTVQRSGVVGGFSAAIGQVTVEPPQPGLEMALVRAV
jgi:hypothetical protein